MLRVCYMSGKVWGFILCTSTVRFLAFYQFKVAGKRVQALVS